MITNQAIVDAILSLHPNTIWDANCGEGWLSRALHENGIDYFGTDAIPELIDAAAIKGGSYAVASYQQIIDGSYLPPEKFEAILFNFSLFGNEIVEQLLQAIRNHLLHAGHLTTQTLHPHTVCGNATYEDGWRASSWMGFADTFCNPAPWYFRTLESWTTLLQNCGFKIKYIKKPIHPGTKKPASLILIAGL